MLNIFIVFIIIGNLIKGDVGVILKETIVVVANVNITAGAALLPTSVSAGEKPIVVASCSAYNPCG